MFVNKTAFCDLITPILQQKFEIHIKMVNNANIHIAVTDK